MSAPYRSAGSWKRLVLAPLAGPGVSGMLARITETAATIFMLHRFAVPELSLEGHDPATVRSILIGLVKRGFVPIALADLFRRLKTGEPLRRAIAFTIDDGYFDHARVGAPIFTSLGIPVTVFVTSGFVDGTTWLWWDRLMYLFTRTRRATLNAFLDGRELRYSLESPEARRRSAVHLSLLCQDASENARQECIAALCHEADVELPAVPPPEFAPLTWDEARRLETQGVGFAPHTVTHPVLSSTSAAHSAAEISQSWSRLQAELRNPVPVFAYPHGRRRDYGDRELAQVAELGLLGGVGGHYADLRPGLYRQPPEICRVPRSAFQDDLYAVLQCVSGIEGLKARSRTRRAASLSTEVPEFRS